MKIKFAAAFLVASATLAFAAAGPAQKAQLDGYAVQAKADNPAFAGFSAERGQALLMAKFTTGKPDTPSCTTCHGDNPKKPGQTRAGKEIGPMALSAKPDRYTDPAETEKWFGRNCDSVIGRACTALEKGDFITFMIGQ
jgi:hypothetical protein